MSCQPSLDSGPRVDFVSSTRFNASNRRLTTPGDTVAVKIFGEAQESTAPLNRLVIKTIYRPRPRPFIYPPLYVERDTATFTLTYLDTTFAKTSEFAFQSTQPARTTAGREEWTYTFTDTDSRAGVRSFFLRLGRNDSAAVFHSYSVPLQAPAGVQDSGRVIRRSFLALLEGLALPKFSVRAIPQNQQLIDVVYVPEVSTGVPTLATTSDSQLNLKWNNPRATQLRHTSLTAAQFATISTLEAFTAAFTEAPAAPFTPRSTSTGPLAEGQVIAFLTPEQKYGLILVRTIRTTGIRTMVLEVRVIK
ncbi:hypothetical protein [Hymenobacter tenuis]